MSLYYYILLFFVYSIIGWVTEIVSVFIKTKKIINRGFLIGPYIPIFGTGALLITCVLGNLDLHFITLFIIAGLISGIVEYLVSFFMEIIFGARWWDYSDFKFNVNGRICLLNLILFGMGSLLILKVFNPIFLELFNSVSLNTIKLISYILLSIYTIDSVATIITLFRIKNKIKELKTKDITERASDLVKEQLLKDTLLIKRIALSHPRLKIIIKKLKQKVI